MKSVKVIFKKTAKNMAYWPGDVAELAADVAVKLAQDGTVEIADAGEETTTDHKAEAALKTAANKKAKK